MLLLVLCKYVKNALSTMCKSMVGMYLESCYTVSPIGQDAEIYQSINGEIWKRVTCADGFD